MSYLPLSYASAQILDMWVAIAVGGTLYFSPQDAEKLGDIPHPPGAVSTARPPARGFQGSVQKGEPRPAPYWPCKLCFSVWASVFLSGKCSR